MDDIIISADFKCIEGTRLILTDVVFMEHPVLTSPLFFFRDCEFDD